MTVPPATVSGHGPAGPVRTGAAAEHQGRLRHADRPGVAASPDPRDRRTRSGREPWRLSEEAAIAAIENERATFYVEWPKGRRLDIVVGQGLGKTYLKTASDTEAPEGLLSLPDCDLISRGPGDPGPLAGANRPIG